MKEAFITGFVYFPYFIWIFSALLIVTLVYIMYRKSIHNGPDRRREKAGDEELSDDKNTLCNSIFIFGDFVAFDKEGQNITHRFTGKLRAMFAVILLASIDKAGGVSTPKLTSLLWPERSLSEAKNIRGVTINHLRAILCDVEGIELVHHNQRWTFVFSGGFYCDFIEAAHILQHTLAKNNDLSEAEINTLRIITRKGGLLPQLKMDWVEQLKNDYIYMMEEKILTMIRKFNNQSDYVSVAHLSEVYFTIDPINEEVLRLCTKSLKKQGKLKQAQALYNRFGKRYEEMMGEPYVSEEIRVKS